MKRARAQQGNNAPQLPDPTLADAGNNPTKPRRCRAKQPRQPKGAKNPAAAAATTTRGEGGSVAIAAAAVASPGPDTVPDVCGEAQAVDWDLLDDAGLCGGAWWWTWGVDEEKLLGWFPFVEEDFRCLGGGRAADAEVAFDDDIWRIHQIHQIPNYAAK